MSTEVAWLESREVRENATVRDAWEYFGVPPDPESQLDKNINQKRRHWRGKKRAQKPSPEAERQIDAVLEMIRYLAEMVKRGVDEPIDLDELNEVFRHKPKTTVGELDELWRVLEELLAVGELDEALKVANQAKSRWSDSALAHSAFSWIAAQASRSQLEPSNRMREDGISSAEFAVTNGEANPDTFWSLTALQLDLNRGAEAMATLERADRELPGGVTSTNLNMLFVEALVGMGDVAEAELRAVAAIRSAPEDLALRSSVAFALITAMRNSLLPIQDAEGLKRYQHVAAVAAWCATGAPEAEDAVRPYRMWSVIADNRMFSGDVAMRAFFAVASGFLLLPMINRLRSKSQWRILWEGPESVGHEVFEEVAFGAVARHVHSGMTSQLVWWSDFVKERPDAATAWTPVGGKK